MHQRTEIIGRLGRDPEMRYTPSGQAVTNFSVAVDNQYTRKDGEKVKDTQWFRVTVWGNQAEACNQYLEKGSLVFAEGKVKLNVYEKKDGTWDGTLELNASSVRFLSRKNGDSENHYEEEEEIPGFMKD